MSKQKLGLRDGLMVAWFGLTYHLGRLIALGGLAILIAWIYGATLVGFMAALLAAWNFLVLALSLIVLGAALWIRERRQDKALKAKSPRPEDDRA